MDFLAYIDMSEWPMSDPTKDSIRNDISRSEVGMDIVHAKIDAYRGANPHDPDVDILERIWRLKAALARHDQRRIYEASLQLADFLRSSPRYGIEDADPRGILRIFAAPETVPFERA